MIYYYVERGVYRGLGGRGFGLSNVYSVLLLGRDDGDRKAMSINVKMRRANKEFCRTQHFKYRT